MREELVKNLLTYQEKQKLTDEQLANLLGISASLVSYLRSGQRSLGIDTVRKIYTAIPELQQICREWTLPELSLADQKQLADL